MIVKPLVTFKGGYMSDHFVFGGTDKKKSYKKQKYDYQVTSYVIETGGEVILIDTSFPDNISEIPFVEQLGVYPGMRVKTFEKALNDAGYIIEDVNKIILTHNNIDHAGAIELFPNAEIYISEKDKQNLSIPAGLNIHELHLGQTDLLDFNSAFQIVPNIYMVQAYGHSFGHSVTIAYDEEEQLYYLFAGDVTVSDEALIENEVFLVYEDLELAKQSLQKIRDFMSKHPTIYLSTHDPVSVDNLENKRILEILE